MASSEARGDLGCDRLGRRAAEADHMAIPKSMLVGRSLGDVAGPPERHGSDRSEEEAAPSVRHWSLSAV